MDELPPNKALQPTTNPLRGFSVAELRRHGAKSALERMLRIVILFMISNVALAQAQDWLEYVQGLGFWERLAEIKSVSELPRVAQRDRVSGLIRLLKGQDQSVRVTAAAEIAQIRDVSEAALPQLIENFQLPNGEEGLEYVEAVAAFEEQALPHLRRALGSSNWLVRTRSCEAVRKIQPKLYSDGECKQKAP